MPQVDCADMRDRKVAFGRPGLEPRWTDGKTFFHEEKKHLETEVNRESDHALHFSVINSDPDRRYSIIKEIITHPHLPCLLQKTRITGSDDFVDALRLYILC